VQAITRSSLATRLLWAGYGLLGLLAIVYLAVLILRAPDASWPLIDDWSVGGFEVIAGAMCIARALKSERGRAMPLILGASLLAWAAGDLIMAAESLGGGSPPTPSLADVFFLGFYPLAYVALVLLLRR